MPRLSSPEQSFKRLGQLYYNALQHPHRSPDRFHSYFAVKRELQLSPRDRSSDTPTKTIMTIQGRYSFYSTFAVCLCLQLSLSIGVVQAEERFDYGGSPNGPKFWGTLDSPTNKLCSHGKQQSPMMITPNIMVTNSSLGDLDAHYSKQPVGATIKINQGYAVELALTDSQSTLQIDGITYKPAQMHFHMGSEHKLLGHSFPMELHLVHTKTDDDNVTHRAVIAFLFVKGKHDNPFLAQFADKLPAADSEGEEFTIDPITYPKLQKSYARYQGSLTTPPCFEGVTWTVMLWDFPTISERQLQLFKAAMPTENARPLQDSHKRKLVIHTDS